MQSRFFLALGAWLVGAATATGGSLLAVSALGQGLSAAPRQQLSVAAVNRVLASEAAERGSDTPPGSLPASPAGTPSPGRRLAPKHRHRAAKPSPAASVNAVLTSQGGTVVARCSGQGAYLVSWSPQQGYGASGVTRGPAASAGVTFEGQRQVVDMVVTCPDGAPSANSTVRWRDE